MEVNNSKDSIIFGIKDLIDSEPRSKLDILDWYKKSEKVKFMIENSEEDIMVPHEVWHYLSDADIRFKDPGYAKIQISNIIVIIDSWGSGD